MLEINSYSFRRLYPNLYDDESRAEKFLDDYYSTGAKAGQLANILGVDKRTVENIYKELREDNSEFFNKYLDAAYGKIKDFEDKQLGESLYRDFVIEIGECEEQYKKCRLSLIDKKENKEVQIGLKEAQWWKREKHRLMEMILKTHIAISRERVKRNEDKEENLDTSISRHAEHLQ